MEQLIANSQNTSCKGFVYSKTSSSPVENAQILIITINNSFRTYTNNYGEFKFDDINKKNVLSIQISHMSYEKDNWNLITDSVFYLKEKVNELQEVEISSTKKEMLYTLPFKNRILTDVRNFSWELKMATFIPQEVGNRNKRIKKLLYATSDFSGVKGLSKQPFVANLYSINDLTGLPDIPIIKDTIIISKKNEAKWVEVDVSRYNLTIPIEGIYIVFEILNKEKYQTGFIQSKNGIIAAVPALKVYSYNKSYIRKSYMYHNYLYLPLNKSNVWVEEDCHYLMDVGF